MSDLADRLLQVLPNAELGRVGRTCIEFVFSASDQSEAERRLVDLADNLRQPLLLDGVSVELVVCIGAVDASGHVIGDELVDLARNALGHFGVSDSQVRFADSTLIDKDAAEDGKLFRHLTRAVAKGELELLYQPKLHARENRFTSAEALLRWHHPRFGTVPADRFIPLAERSGLIGRLTDWVLARIVTDQAALVAAGHRLDVYMNLSGQLVSDPAFAERALAAVAAAAAPIGFEITETAVIAEPEAALANLHRFRAAGIRIAIDDYGSGLSSLAYLKQLPAHELKIDRQFVSGLVDSHRDPLLVRSSIDLAHALEMEVTAEGVDDPVALALLRVMGCDLLQGYLISPPIPIAELMVLLGKAEAVAHLIPAVAPGWPPAYGQTGR